jgi:hypothetical protein
MCIDHWNLNFAYSSRIEGLPTRKARVGRSYRNIQGRAVYSAIVQCVADGDVKIR